MLIKKYIFLFLLLPIFLLVKAQNFAIKDASGALLPTAKEFCPGDVFNLHVDADATSSGDYKITKEQPATFSISAGTSPINFVTTGTNLDKFSKPIDLGFPFSFYGHTYTQVVAGINGRLVFTNDPVLGNLSDNTVYKDKTFTGDRNSGAITQLPSANYNQVFLNSANSVNLAQIFFGFTDMYHTASTATTYYYKSVTIGGVKGLLISYQNEIHGDSTGFSSRVFESYVILLADGRIVIYVNNKTEITYKALLGIQNETGTKYKVPDHSNAAYNYNNGNWASEGVAFVFSPNLNLTPKIDWLLNGNPVNANPQPNKNFPNYTPNDGDTLEADISYLETPTDITKSFVKFNSYKKPIISATPGTTCGSGTTLTITNPQPGYTYSWKSGDPAFTATGTSITAPKTGNYYAVPNGCDAQKSDPVAVTISSPITPPSFADNTNFPVCDNLGKASAPINLLQLVNYTPDANSMVVFTDTAGNTIADAANNYTANINSGATLNAVIKISSSAVVCPISKAFSVSYLSFPAAQFPLTTPKLCFGTSSYSVANFKTDFPQYAGFDLSFSTDNANFGANPVNPGQSNPIYVKLSKSGFSCTSVATLNFDFYPEVIANDPVIPAAELQQCASSSQFFDLQHLAETYINNSGNVDFKFYTSLADAQNGNNAIPNPQYRSGKGDTTIFVVVSDKSTGCKAMNIRSFTITVYNKPALLSTLKTSFTHCQENPIFLLPTAVSDYVSLDPKVAASIKFFDANNNEISAAQFANYDASLLGNTPYAAISYNSTCGATVQFTLNFYPKPALSATQVPVCGQSSYSLQDFENFITNNAASGYTFADENGNPLPANFDVKSSLPTVKVVITDKNTGCKSDVQTAQFVVGNPSPTVSTSVDLPAKCDTDFDGIGISFNLNDAKPLISADASAVFEYFSDAGRSVKIDPNFVNTAAGAQTIYGKVTSDGFCPVNFEIHLKINTPTQSSTLQPKYLICYGDRLAIDAGLENINFTWSDGQTGQVATFTAAGSYTVTLTNSAGCSYTYNFVISDENQPKISQINQTDSQMEVIANGGTQPYTYFFNGSPSASNILQNPTADSYEIYVQGADGCRGPSKFLYNIIIKNVITPNGDGTNDVWTVKNLDKMENQEIIISDRYGKTVYHGTDKNSLIWDGTSNGRALPTASYWYAVKWHDPATNKDEVRTGWILLKNRD